MGATIWPLRTSNPPYRKPESCKACPLHQNGMGFGFPEFGGGNGVGVVVESLGANEEQQGKPLVSTAPAGWMFERVLKRGGFKREDFTFIDNVIHCKPPFNKLAGTAYEYAATQECAHFLDDTIAQTRPRVLLAMGAIPLKRLSSVGGGITRNRGFVYSSPYDIPVVGTFHPSYLLPRKKEKASAKYTWVVIMDIRKALRFAEGKQRLYPQHYLEDPSLDRAKEFVNEYRQTSIATKMAWDLETLYKMKTRNEQKYDLEKAKGQPVQRISFAFKPGYAMSIPWDANYIQHIIKPIFEMDRPKVGWNSHGFDEPLILLQEKMILNGVLLDGMDQFHMLQPNVERNLEFATSILTDHLKPWKHLSGAEPVFYSCVDADATITDVLMMDEMMAEREIPDYGISDN